MHVAPPKPIPVVKPFEERVREEVDKILRANNIFPRDSSPK